MPQSEIGMEKIRKLADAPDAFRCAPITINSAGVTGWPVLMAIPGTDPRVTICGCLEGSTCRQNGHCHNGPGNEGTVGGILKGKLLLIAAYWLVVN